MHSRPNYTQIYLTHSNPSVIKYIHEYQQSSVTSQHYRFRDNFELLVFLTFISVFFADNDISVVSRLRLLGLNNTSFNLFTILCIENKMFEVDVKPKVYASTKPNYISMCSNNGPILRKMGFKYFEVTFASNSLHVHLIALWVNKIVTYPISS